MHIEHVPYNSVNYRLSLQLRNEVLRKPLGMEITAGDVFDEDKHLHIVALEGDDVVGIVVLIPDYLPGIGKLRQMATLPEVRGKGYGKALVADLEQTARTMGLHTIRLHARYHAVDFYAKLGYRIVGERFTEVGIDHYRMEKDL